MFLLLKVILIILLSETYAYVTQNSEIILLPAWNPIDTKKISLTLKVFGKQIQLNLRKKEEMSQLNAPNSCYYFHEDHISTAIINFCQEEHGLKGMVFLENTTLDISPLQNNFATSSLLDNSCIETETNVSFGKPHLIKHLPDWDQFHVNNRKSRQRRSQNDTKKRLNLKLAIYLDEAAYYRLLPFHNENETKIRNMLLAYVNSLEAVLQHPSLGASINILLRHMEIMKIQPTDLPHYTGHANRLRDSFCNYANQWPINIKYDWDVALYLTGFNLYDDMDLNRDGFRAFNDTIIRGIASKNGLCMPWSCAIVEFGARDYGSIPTSGFGSIYSAAQQIGILFGMTFDGRVENDCPMEGHIMSFSWREMAFHKTTWSKCSREIAMRLWQTKTCLLDGEPEDISYQYLYINSTEQIKTTIYFNDNHDYIKREWSAKRQCELFLLDEKADVVTLDNACKFLQCEAPNQRYFFKIYNYLNHDYIFTFNNYFAGPALDGTYCALRRECHHGTCSLVESSKISNYNEYANWSEWKEESCKKNCLEKSKGIIIRRRICQDRNGVPSANCDGGSSYDVKLCDDSSLCSEQPRLPIKIYINKKCELFDFPLTGGMQMTHDFNRPWLACSIFCRKKRENNNKNVSIYIALIKNVSNIIRSYPYLPDGTWCHTDSERQHYFCRKHQCLLKTTKTENCRKTFY